MINSQHTAEDQYYNELQTEVLSLISRPPRRVLEIGCGLGNSLVFLKKQGAEFVAGIEIVPSVALRARQRPEIDEILEADFEHMSLPWTRGSFDLVIASHVLEHLRDPWSALRRIQDLLTPEGRIVGAVPNVRNFRVVFPLLFAGRWRYEPSGIMDWTHLRFFSRETLQRALSQTGYTGQAIQPDFGRGRAGMINRASFGIFSELLCFAFVFSAQKAPGKPTPSTPV